MLDIIAFVIGVEHVLRMEVKLFLHTVNNYINYVKDKVCLITTK